MRSGVFSTIAVICLIAVACPTFVSAQTNDNDYTPLNSRIRRDRQFPLEPRPNFVPVEKMAKVERDQTRSMANQFAKCLFRRSQSDSLALLDKTDFGFVNFDQIGMTGEKAMKIYGFHDCLGRVADTNNTGVAMRFYPMNLRQWLIQAAYFDRYPHGPTWLKAGYVMAARTYPLSGNVAAVHASMDLGDCIVTSDPNGADYFYRTAAGSDAEKEALTALTPSIGPCVPQGVQLRLQPAELRNWVGEALWQAANHSVPAPEGAPAAAH
jgi:hypothetical protein